MIDDEVFQVSIARYPKGAVSIVQIIVKMSQEASGEAFIKAGSHPTRKCEHGAWRLP
jgi:aromatic ring-opening dioxygenase catalytic subunit (LigB family)